MKKKAAYQPLPLPDKPVVNAAVLWPVPAFILITGLLYAHHTVDAVLMPKFLGLCFFALAATVRVLTVSKKAFRLNLDGSSRLFFALYAAYLLLAVPGLWRSINAADGIFEWLKMFLPAGLLFSGIALFHNPQPVKQVFVRSIVVFNVILVLTGAWQLSVLAGTGEVTHKLTYSINAFFGHKNIYAEILFLCFPFVSYAAMCEKRYWQKGAILCTIATVFMITILLTRAVWFAAVAGLIITLPFLLISLVRNSSSDAWKIQVKKIVLVLLIVFASVLSGIIIYSSLDKSGPFKKQLLTLVNFRYGTAAERISLWEKSMMVFKENPVWGSGPGSWKTEVLKYGHRGLESENNRTFHQRPHNDFIWILCEQGMVGLLLWLSVTGMVLYLLAAALIKEKDNKNRLFYFACLYAFCGLLLFSIFSFPKERVEHWIIVVFIYYFALHAKPAGDAQPQPSLERSHQKRRMIYVPLLFIILFSGYTGAMRTSGEIHLLKAYKARANGNWQEVTEEIRRAEGPFFNMDPMCTPLSWYSGSAYYNLGNQPLAFEEFKRAYVLNPHHIHVLNNLATAHELKGEHTIAAELYRKAIYISPGFTEARLNLVAALYNGGDKKGAFDEFFRITTDTLSDKYRMILPLVVRPEVLRLRDSVSCNDLKMKIEAIYNVSDWSKNIFKKSLQQQKGFGRQVMEDAIFIMDSLEKTANFACLSDVRKKYGIK